MKITRFRDLKSKQMFDARLKHRLIYNVMQNLKKKKEEKLATEDLI